MFSHPNDEGKGRGKEIGGRGMKGERRKRRGGEEGIERKKNARRKES